MRIIRAEDPGPICLLTQSGLFCLYEELGFVRAVRLIKDLEIVFLIVDAAA